LANCVSEPSQNLAPSLKHKTKENFCKLAKPNNELIVLPFFNENSISTIARKNGNYKEIQKSQTVKAKLKFCCKGY